MSRWFEAVDDHLLEELPGDFRAVVETLRELSKLLAVDSYDDMGQATEHRDQLLKLERTLHQHLALPLKPAAAADISSAPLSVREAWYAALVAANDYALTVGSAQTIIASLPLRSLPKFEAAQVDQTTHHAWCQHVAQTLALPADSVQRIEVEHAQRAQRLRRAQQLVDALRKQISTNGEMNRAASHAVFLQLFPDCPLTATEIDVVVTSTALYWALVDPDEVETDRRSEDDIAAVQRWVKQARRFRFEQFTHFPMFGIFDARDTTPVLIDTLALELDWSASEVRRQLDRCVMLESRGQLEKYLVHDTWGHVWQAYLCDLQPLYDRLATMQFPVAADYHVEANDGDVVCLADCFYLHHDGHVSFDSSVADRLIKALIEERVEALLVSICAELAADIVEYGFAADQAAQGHVLPSSSLFDHNPTKLDFAWADMQYFARAVRRPLRHYQRNPSLRASLDQRLAEILRLKYPRHQAAVNDKDLLAAIDTSVSRYIDMFVKAQDQALAVDFAAGSGGGRVSVNVFTRVITNLLRIQFAANDLEQAVTGSIDQRFARCQLLLFIVFWYQRDPSQNFWSLDEVLADWAPSLLGTLSAAPAE